MKKTLCAFLILALLALPVITLSTGAASASAASGNEFSYKVVDGNAVVTAYNGSKTNVIVPAELDGYPVTAIGDKAFENRSVEHVQLPEGLTEIGEYAFSRCYFLTQIQLPKSLKSIGFAAFIHTVNLRSIDLPEGLESIGNEVFIGSSLQRIVIPSSVETVGDYAFYTCSSMTEAMIPASVTTLGDAAFGWCSALTDIYCEAEEMPEGWHADWLWEDKDITVHWNFRASLPAPGDLTGDGTVDATDYLLLKRSCLGTFGLSIVQEAVADVNGDNDVNAMDYMLVKRHVLGTYKIA